MNFQVVEEMTVCVHKGWHGKHIGERLGTLIDRLYLACQRACRIYLLGTHAHTQISVIKKNLISKI